MSTARALFLEEPLGAGVFRWEAYSYPLHEAVKQGRPGPKRVVGGFLSFYFFSNVFFGIGKKLFFVFFKCFFCSFKS